MTDKPKFTPGPWLYRPSKYDDWGVVKVDRFVICQARDHRHLDEGALAVFRENKTDPWEANARLISAAPDMYDALVMWLDKLRGLSGPGVNLQTLLNITDAAIAKANGEQS